MKSEEFIQGAYNQHEHDHTTWDDRQLHDEIAITAELLEIPHPDERRHDLEQRQLKAEKELEWRKTDSMRRIGAFVFKSSNYMMGQ